MRTPNRPLACLLLLSFAAVSFLEILLPRGIAIWVLFIPLISLSRFTLQPGIPLLISAGASIFLFADLILVENHPLLSIAGSRRLIGVVAFFSVALIVRYVINRRRQDLHVRQSLEISARTLTKEKNKLERSNRELEQFASVAAHDLRSPIKSLRSWVNELADRLGSAPRDTGTAQALHIIGQSAQRADELVEDILQIARVQASVSNTESINLNDVVAEILSVLKPEIDNVGARISASEMPSVIGNRTYLTSVFSNLIRNALAYRHPERRVEIQLGFKESRDQFEFYVEDNGIGVPSDKTAEIFEMFKRLQGEQVARGNGIGLAFCKKVVELAGGRIWVRSQLGQGSTFFFTYPKTLQTATSAPSPRETPSLTGGPPDSLV